jgi:hypothetical protein
MEQLDGLLLMDKKRKFVNLSNNFMVWNKHLNNNMKNLIRLWVQNKIDKYIYVKNTIKVI